MKKTITIAIAILAAVGLFAGCANDAQPASTPTPKPTAEPTEEATKAPENIVYTDLDAQYIRTDGYTDGRQYPISTLIGSEDDLAQYIETYNADYYLDEERGDGASFTEAVQKYDADFFINQVLVLVLLEEGSGSIRHEAMAAHVADSDITVDIKRLIPEVGTDDMAEWHIIIELPIEGIASQEVEVNLSE